jgi:hypothetical protein
VHFNSKKNKERRKGNGGFDIMINSPPIFFLASSDIDSILNKTPVGTRCL